MQASGAGRALHAPPEHEAHLGVLLNETPDLRRDAVEGQEDESTQGGNVGAEVLLLRPARDGLRMRRDQLVVGHPGERRDELEGPLHLPHERAFP
ncbi:MAG TPA: hypothetical protein DGR79_03120 [Clostridiales bacterium]|nr:hypothetical protein [Clostridiales bacterium]